MKINISLIRSEYVAEALRLSRLLTVAVEAGEMQSVDRTAEHLLSLTDNGHSVKISEELWHRFISSVRNIDNRFTSNFLIEKSQLETIVSAGLRGMFDDIVKLANKALELESVLLQISYEED